MVDPVAEIRTRRPGVISPKYTAHLLRHDWPSAMVPWLDYLGVPHRVVNTPGESDKLPWDGVEFALSPACKYGPLYWMYCALHYGAALNDNKSPDRVDLPGLGLSDKDPAALSVIEVRVKKAAMALAVSAGANEDWLWRPAMDWKLTKAALTERPEDLMGRHMDQVRLKIPVWRRHFTQLDIPEAPILWNTVLMDA